MSSAESKAYGSQPAAFRERLLRKLPHAIKVPAASTIHAILDRHGLVRRASRPRTRAEGTPLSEGLNPNDLWCADYKGEFQFGDKRCCYPLTVTDQASRFLLLCEALESTREDLAFPAFERLFRERGLPQAIRSDNGVPFAAIRQKNRVIRFRSAPEMLDTFGMQHGRNAISASRGGIPADLRSNNLFRD